jgi:DNA (cytosine-5)-methyltransferase 1
MKFLNGENMDDKLTFGSLFAGIGGFDLGFERAGMECVWQCEIDNHARAVLQKQFGVKIYDDVRTITAGNTETVDLICGGFPCQDVSVAGKRKGLAGERSGLWFEFARIIDELEPAWVVIENVTGLLSSNRGRDFAVIIQWLAERGYGVAWRVLDSQYFGVAQRRRRVFIVGSFGNGNASKVLFESEGVRWNPPSRGKTWKENTGETSPSLVSNGDSHSGFSNESGLVSALQARDYKGVGNQYVSENKCVLVENRMTAFGENVPLVGVRRLTPTECERLQGFPDGWTDGQSDSQRYKQLGNAVTVNVAEWIGKVILEVESKEKHGNN